MSVSRETAYEACKIGRITRDEPSDGEIATMAKRLEWFAARLSQVAPTNLRECTQWSQGAQGEAGPVIDLDAIAWEQIKEAAAQSQWMPTEYTANDWHADVCEFLHNGPAEHAAVPDWMVLIHRDDLEEVVGDAIKWLKSSAGFDELGSHRDGIVKLYEELLTAAPQPPEGARVVDDWQPIETAPRNATPILIYVPSHERKPVFEAWWAIEYEGGLGHWQTPIGPKGRGYTILPEAPTHWMPLPATPTLAGKEGAND